jgi:hypothetical protein
VTVQIEMARKHFNQIVAYDGKGGCYILNHKFSGQDCPKLRDTVLKINAARTINLSHWRKSPRTI